MIFVHLGDSQSQMNIADKMNMAKHYIGIVGWFSTVPAHMIYFYIYNYINNRKGILFPRKYSIYTKISPSKPNRL